MKYQIYLNKETSITVNKLAEKANQKPNSYIKKFIEGFMRIYNATSDQIEKELAKDKELYGDKQQ